ncbi:MAG: aryl-sulfate sulfotransferase [Candidatus Solibacter usitatus]|nr:aryl-sulfate sulfotransferase [Candidatus Solibacter usitatus]
MQSALQPERMVPVPVGTPIRWSASANGSGPAALSYRFRVREAGGDFTVVRDYGADPVLNWAPSEREGAYEMEVTVRDAATGAVSQSSTYFDVTSRAAAGEPVVVGTENPLVYLYSAPPCTVGQRIRVEFTAPDGAASRTTLKNCAAGRSTNFYLAGLYAQTKYAARHLIYGGSKVITGPEVSFQTDAIPESKLKQTVLIPARPGASDGILINSSSSMGTIATDLSGRVLWSSEPGLVSNITRHEDGFFWGYKQNNAAGPEAQLIRKFDLTGKVLLESNAARVNEQLRALEKREIGGFHHEVAPLPGGRILALAGVEQILTDVQGPGPVNVLGDMIIVFDQDLNVIWTWDAFDHLDVTRKAVLGETCRSAGACPPLTLAKEANDWTHGNSVTLTPDGNLLFSIRHQDWVVKIAYENGGGDGHVIWRLGKDGDFRFPDSDVYPWFSHQHDANFSPSNPTQLLIFDNGNTRIAKNGPGNSRGQVLQLDERNMTVEFVLNADLGVYSTAVGSAQILRNGNYHFNAGYVPEGTVPTSHAIELDSSGRILYDAVSNSILYRTFRRVDMYSPD